MNLVRGFILTKELFGTVESFDAEEAKSKKLFEDLKALGLEKAQLEFEKRALQFELDFVVTKEANMKAKYEIELKAANECLKQARDQKRAAEASQKHAEESQKLVVDRTLAAEIALATVNSSLEAATVKKKKSLVETKLELERVKAERTNTEAKVVEAYQDTFVDTPEYQDLLQRLMTIGGEQLVERIMETQPKWDISFLRQAPIEAPTSAAASADNRDGAEGQTTPLFVEEGPQCADP
ncbi:hypothetical protein Adt_21858 [Abeliophyllum distichum]|uniref:Uncharacterized protein n=1 Tax=Abeliophyllum distichum TaxID=126358 RepID=A0ABD1T0K9_9LAMI